MAVIFALLNGFNTFETFESIKRNALSPEPLIKENTEHQCRCYDWRLTLT